MSPFLEKQLRRIPQYTRLRRHVRSFVMHSTPRKIANLLLVETEWLLRRERVRGHPYILFIDPTNICNLRCPLCPTGTGDLGRRGGMLSYECFTQIIDRAAPYAYEVSLHNWGEPLLNRDVFKMIEYAHQKGIGTNMSTNLNTVRDTDVEDLAHSSLEYLIVSLDGITEDVYARYRRRGNFDLVMRNLRSLLELRRRLNRKIPFIEWQFIVMKHNIHQVDEARALAEEIGVDLLRFIPVGLPLDAKDKAELREEWFPELAGAGDRQGFKYQFLQAPRKSACFYLYRALVVNPDGKVAPCCVVYGEQNDFGDILAEDVQTLRNNDHFRSARALFSTRGRPTTATICDGCDIFQRRAEQPRLPPKKTTSEIRRS